MITCILTKEQRDNFNYVPENSEDGVSYTWQDLMDIANDNEKVAYLLYQECTSYNAWAHPETYLDDNLHCEEILEDKQGNYYINLEYDFELVLED